MAEMHWQDLWDVMESYVRCIPSHCDLWIQQAQANGLGASKMRAEALQLYPHVSTSLFRYRTEMLYQYVLGPVLGIDD
eukprot:423055-Rhodomonas_salina.1